jgi:hypothetical protein
VKKTLLILSNQERRDFAMFKCLYKSIKPSYGIKMVKNNSFKIVNQGFKF